MKSLQRSYPGGSILVGVIVCLGVATSIMLTSVHWSLRARRQLARELQMEQTRWLVDAGFARVRNQMRLDVDYDGETWVVEPPLSDELQATIEIKTRAEGEQTLVEVIAIVRDRNSQTPPTRRTGSQWLVTQQLQLEELSESETTETPPTSPGNES